MPATMSLSVQDDKNPTRDELQAITESIESAGRKGAWILGPKTLALDDDRDATIYGWDYYEFKLRGLRYWDDVGVVVATRLESRETFATKIFEPKRPANDDEDEATPEIPEGDNLITFQFDLRDRLQQLPWRSGTYLVDLAMDGIMSNRIEIAITPGKAAERDPAIAAFIEQQKGRSVGPMDFIPQLAGIGVPALRTTLELPWVEGISLKIDRVTVYTPEARNILQGSFRLMIPPAFYRSANAGEPTATVPITLVITGNDVVGPFVLPLRVPTYDPVTGDGPESEVTGRFAVDLFSFDQTARLVQTYTIWAYCGTIRSEPVLNAIITPDMLQ